MTLQVSRAIHPLCCMQFDSALVRPPPSGQPAWAARPCWHPAVSWEPQDPAPCFQGRPGGKETPTKASPSPPTFNVESKTQHDSGHSPSSKNGVSSPHSLGCGACCKGHFPGRWQCHFQRSERGGTPKPPTVKLLGQPRWTKTAC